jgi:hypothetical protein
MKTVRRVEFILTEDVPIVPPGTPTERIPVVHNLSPDQAFESILKFLTSLDAILTPDEMKDRLAFLEKALVELRSRLGIERAGRDHLTIHEA